MQRPIAYCLTAISGIEYWQLFFNRGASVATKIMYCATPSRLRHKSGEVKEFARKMGYVPVIPFDVGPFEEFEGGKIGRARTIALMLQLERGCDATGVFGLSDGTMLEFEDAIIRRQEVRLIPELDPEWDMRKDGYNKQYGPLFGIIRERNWLVVLVGPTAIGKTFWSDWLLENYFGRLRRVRNTTTRTPRNDADRDSYRFISEEEFKREIDSGNFLEHDRYLNDYYGSSRKEIANVLQFSSGIFALTPKGAAAVYKLSDECNVGVVLLLPESEDVLLHNFDRRSITDVGKRRMLIEKAKEFKLGSAVTNYATVHLSGDFKTDKSRILAAIAPYIL
jgi:guanylate kinase